MFEWSSWQWNLTNWCLVNGGSVKWLDILMFITLSNKGFIIFIPAFNSISKTDCSFCSNFIYQAKSLSCLLYFIMKCLSVLG